MYFSLRRLAPCLLACFLAVAPLRADVMEWRGSLELDPLGPGLPTLARTATGLAEIHATPAGLGLASLRLWERPLGSTVLPVTDPGVTAGGVVALQLSASLAAGTLSPFHPPAPPGSAQLALGALPLRGALRLCLLLVSCDAGLDVRLTSSTANGPVGAGVGGTVVSGTLGAVSVLGAPWTLRTAVLPVQTSSGASAFFLSAGWRHGPLSLTGSTALPGGAVGLVSPLRIESSQGSLPVAGFARLGLHFVPEPGAMGLLAAGGALLLAARARFARRRRP